MAKKAIFYHAGCPVCVAAEKKILDMIDRNKFDLEIVHLGQEKAKVAQAEKAGVKSVPALVVDNEVLHINFGASLADVKKG